MLHTLWESLDIISKRSVILFTLDVVTDNLEYISEPRISIKVGLFRHWHKVGVNDRNKSVLRNSLKNHEQKILT